LPFWRKYCPKFLKIFRDEYLEGKSKAGWQYYISKKLPKTNNNIEAYNRTLKDYVTQRKYEDFSSYYEMIKQEVFEKSKIMQNLPVCPTIPEQFYRISKTLADFYANLYLESNNCFYIKDKSVNFNFMNKNKTGLVTPIHNILKKIGSDSTATKTFIDYFKQPTLEEAKQYEKPGILRKEESLEIFKIRRISKIAPLNEEFPILSFECTCPNFSEVRYCIHVLGVLIKLKYISAQHFIAKKKRGRRLNVSGALEHDVSSSEEDSLDQGQE